MPTLLYASLAEWTAVVFGKGFRVSLRPGPWPKACLESMYNFYRHGFLAPSSVRPLSWVWFGYSRALPVGTVGLLRGLKSGRMTPDVLDVGWWFWVNIPPAIDNAVGHLRQGSIVSGI